MFLWFTKISTFPHSYLPRFISFFCAFRTAASGKMEGAPSLNSPSENGSSFLSNGRVPASNSCWTRGYISHSFHTHVCISWIILLGRGSVFKLHRPCRAVLDRLFLIVIWPVRQVLDMEPVGPVFLSTFGARGRIGIPSLFSKSKDSKWLYLSSRYRLFSWNWFTRNWT